MGPQIKQKRRRLAPDQQQVEDEEVKKMEEEGIIRPSKAPWASPTVLVRKKDGTVRFCIDYRKLNAITVKDAYPTPNIEDLLRMGARAKYFSSLDAISGYWQIPMAEESIPKTAFVSRKGLYEFLVMPFGATNAMATFQRFTSGLLEGLDFAGVYVDDILVASESFEQHMEHLTIVFARLRKAHFKLKMAKCHFAKTRITYLGFDIENGKVFASPGRIKAIQDFPVPQDLKQLQRFMGIINYSRRFIPHLATIAEPLYHLNRKAVHFGPKIRVHE